jgi:hypothetical protein
MSHKAITEWNLGCVNAVLQNEREIIGLNRQPYGVGEQSMTGGPVLRGPWGSIGGMQSQYTEYEAKCKQFISAFIHGHLAGARVACEAFGCIGYDTLPYCQRCGGNAPQKPTS